MITFLLGGTCAIGLIVFCVFIWALCVSAARADEAMGIKEE